MKQGYPELYRSLKKHRVKYLLVGGMAAVLYGSPRLTKDVDILIEPSLVNAMRLLKALTGAGFGTAVLTTAKKVLANEITVFNDFIRLDVLTEIKGVSFENGWKNKRIRRLGKIPIPVLRLIDLIRAKKASGRQIDLQDVKILNRIRKLNH